MKVHEPLVQFTSFHASAFIDLVFRKPWVSSPKKIAELRPDLTSKFFIQALTTLMFFPFTFFVSFLMALIDSRRSGAVTLPPNCRVKYNSVWSSVRLTNFLIDSIRTVVFTFISMPIIFFSKSVNVICRGALRNFWTKFCLRLRWCLESCAAVV